MTRLVARKAVHICAPVPSVLPFPRPWPGGSRESGLLLALAPAMALFSRLVGFRVLNVEYEAEQMSAGA